MVTPGSADFITRQAIGITNSVLRGRGDSCLTRFAHEGKCAHLLCGKDNTIAYIENGILEFGAFIGLEESVLQTRRGKSRVTYASAASGQRQSLLARAGRMKRKGHIVPPQKLTKSW